MASSGASPEDVAKTLLIQNVLRTRGVPTDVIAAALNKIIKNAGNQKDLVTMIENSLKNNDISIDEINKVLAMSKALDGGKIRGLRDLQQILDENRVSLRSALLKAMFLKVLLYEYRKRKTIYCEFLEY